MVCAIHCLEVLVVLDDVLMANTVSTHDGVAVGDDLSDGEGTRRDIQFVAADGYRGVVDADVLVVDEARRLELDLEDGAEDDARIRIDE